MEVCVTHCASPIGMLRISGTADGITGVTFLDGWDEHRVYLQERSVLPSALMECAEQLQEYFSGKRKEFTALRIIPMGTAFQRRVWGELLRMSWGTCMTYGELGRRAGYPVGAQAIGAAVSRNPLAVIIPCHRVLRKGEGGAGDYAWGSWRKQWLLRHEGVAPHPALSPSFAEAPAGGRGERVSGVGITRRVLYRQSRSSLVQTPPGCVA